MVSDNTMGNGPVAKRELSYQEMIASGTIPAAAIAILEARNSRLQARLEAALSTKAAGATAQAMVISPKAAMAAIAGFSPGAKAGTWLHSCGKGYKSLRNGCIYHLGFVELNETRKALFVDTAAATKLAKAHSTLGIPDTGILEGSRICADVLVPAPAKGKSAPHKAAKAVLVALQGGVA